MVEMRKTQDWDYGRAIAIADYREEYHKKWQDPLYQQGEIIQLQQYYVSLAFDVNRTLGTLQEWIAVNDRLKTQAFASNAEFLAFAARSVHSPLYATHDWSSKAD